MAGLTRKTSILFGGQGPTSSFAQFGSKEAGNPQFSQDPTVIQQLAAWSDGWQSAVVSGDYAAYLEDMNGFCYVDSYQLCYLFQMGIPEWDTNTLYFTGSVVQVASTGQWFRSLQGGVPGVGAGQSGNAPPSGASNAFWKWINPSSPTDGGMTNGFLPLASGSGPAALVNSHVQDNGTDIVIGLPLQFPDGSVQSTAAGALSPHFGTITVNGGPGGSGSFACSLTNFTPSLPSGTTVIPFVTVQNTGGGNSGVSGSWQTGSLTGTGTLIGPGNNGAWRNVGINSTISFGVNGNGGGSSGTWVITAWI